MSEEPQAQITVANGRIYVRTHYHHKERFKAVDGARWDGQFRAWTYPADQFTAGLLKEALRGIGTCRVSEDFKALLAGNIPDHGKAVVRNVSWSGPDPLTPLWAHQRRAVELALQHEGFYFAHDMGAGKSLSAIAVMLKREAQRILIFAPKRVVRTWKEQIEAHAGDLIVPVPLDKGTVAKRTALAADMLQAYGPTALIINYEAAIGKQFKEWSLKQKWDLIVADEAHRTKSPGGVISKYMAVLGRRATARLCLSGTPMPNGPLDIYAQFRFLDPAIFGTSYTRFKALYAIPNPNFPDQVVEYINTDDLHQKFYSIADRVLTRDVVELPDERDIALTGEMGAEARRVYEEVAEDFYANLGDENTVTITNTLTKLLRLQQITSGYIRDDEGVEREVDDTKAELLAELLESLPDDEPLVLFAKFRHDLDTIRRVVGRTGRTYGELSGRADDYAAWQRGAINTIGIQIQAGGEGLNALVSARYCVYFSVGYSLKDYNQSRARVMRPGQERSVTYYHLIVENSIDETVYKALQAKEEIIDGILRDVVVVDAAAD